MTLIFNKEFAINPQSNQSGGGGGEANPVFRGTYLTSNNFNVYKNTSFSAGGSGHTGGIECDLSSVVLPETINSAAFILKIRPINQVGSANSIFFTYDPSTSLSQNKIQLNGSNELFAYYDRITGSNSQTTDSFNVSHNSIGLNAYFVAIVFDGAKNYGYITKEDKSTNPITNSNLCNIALDSNAWHKTAGFVGNGVSGSFLKNNYKYLIGTGGLLSETTSQMFSGIIHLDSVELRINNKRVWTLIS